jgi:hypothetical protein
MAAKVSGTPRCEKIEPALLAANVSFQGCHGKRRSALLQF